MDVVEEQSNGKCSQNDELGQNGKLDHSCVRVTKGRLYDSWVRDKSCCEFRMRCKQLRP